MEQKDLVKLIDPDFYDKLSLRKDEEDRMNNDNEVVILGLNEAHTSHNLMTAPAVSQVLKTESEKPYDELNNLCEFVPTEKKELDMSAVNLFKKKEAEKRLDVLNNSYETDLKVKEKQTSKNIPESVGDESNIAAHLMRPPPEEIVMEDKPFVMRSYQKELSESACQGKNVIICAPTGSGKTHVALNIIANHMKSIQDRNAKVIFLVNQKALAEQQLSVLKEHMGVRHQCIQVNGDTELSVPFHKIIETNDILVVTAQILLDSLNRGDVKSMRMFSLLVFDECHHTKDKHPFNCIMLRYLKEKYPDITNPQNVLHGMPQIVGLTASVGVGKAKAEEDAVTHINKLCANLDIDRFCTVENEKEELSKYTNTADHSILSCMPRASDEFKTLVETIMKKIEGIMHNFCETARMNVLIDQLPSVVKCWSAAYYQWVSKIRKEIARIKDRDLRRTLESARRYLEIYYNALAINEDCRTKDAFTYLESKMNLLQNDQGNDFTDEEKIMHELFDKHKTTLETANTHDNNGSKNPKLKRLHSLIQQCFDENPDSRAIVFVKTRELATALENWIKETAEFNGLNPRKMVGAGASAERGGMTQSQQVDVMTCFRDGRHKIIVATSVAQEGLDVTKCNMVIQYDYNTNEIAMVQARGRARAENSQYAVIASKESSVEKKEEVNLLREKLMNDAIKTLKDQMTNDVESYENKKRDHQIGSLTAMRLEESTRNTHNLNLREGDFELNCARCGHHASFSSDLRIIKDSHHIVIDPRFEDQIKVKVHPRPISFTGIEKKGKLQCRNCSDDWGIVIKHKGHFYPVIKIEKFSVVDSMQSIKSYKHWKNVNFKILSLEIDNDTPNIDASCDILLEL